jgi:hypothetical protein
MQSGELRILEKIRDFVAEAGIEVTAHERADTMTLEIAESAVV